MGSCFSAAAAANSGVDETRTAKIVWTDGFLREFSTTIEVSEVLGDDHLSCFLCNSDCLCYDDYIQALSPNEFIVPGQLYFLLPIDMLKRTLSGPDMAALAVKASSALANVSKNKKKRGTIGIRPFAGELAHREKDEFMWSQGGDDLSATQEAAE